MVPNTRLEAEIKICGIKTQITDFFEDLMSYDYEPYMRTQEWVAMDASEHVQFQATA